MSMENHDGMILTGETPDLSIRDLWQSFQQSSSSKAAGTGKGDDEFCLTKYLFHNSKCSLTCCKILTWGSRLYLSSEGRHAADFYHS
jgi:hypothetical protein